MARRTERNDTVAGDNIFSAPSPGVCFSRRPRPSCPQLRSPPRGANVYAFVSNINAQARIPQRFPDHRCRTCRGPIVVIPGDLGERRQAAVASLVLSWRQRRLDVREVHTRPYCTPPAPLISLTLQCATGKLYAFGLLTVRYSPLLPYGLSAAMGSLQSF
jgi:hypothetical protein